MCDMKYVKRIKVWDKEIVFDPNINIIIGPNGSGKTRLLSLLARGLRPRVFPGGDDYEIEMSDGEVITNISPISSGGILVEGLRNWTSLNSFLNWVYQEDYSDILGGSWRKRSLICPKEAIEWINSRLVDKELRITDSDLLRLVLTEDGKELSEASGGETRLIYFVLTARKGVFLWDCPERSISITTQAELMKKMTEIYPETQFIITTHSPEILADLIDKVITL